MIFASLPYLEAIFPFGAWTWGGFWLGFLFAVLKGRRKYGRWSLF